MSVSGQVVAVRIEDRGSESLGDTSVGSTTILAADPTPFEVGGMVTIDGTVYTLAAVTEVDDPDEPDSTNALLALDVGLAADVEDGTPISLWSGSQILNDVKLDVVTAPDEPPITVAVSTNQRKDWSILEGPVEPPIAVTLADDLLTLQDAPGFSPVISQAVVASAAYSVRLAADQNIPTGGTGTVLTAWQGADGTTDNGGQDGGAPAGGGGWYKGSWADFRWVSAI